MDLNKMFERFQWLQCERPILHGIPGFSTRQQSRPFRQNMEYYPRTIETAYPQLIF